MRFVVVTGAGGFIGHHLVKRLCGMGRRVRGIDLRAPEFEPSPGQEFICADLRESRNALDALAGADEVYALAANMGGIGFIETHKAEIIRDNTLITLNTLEAARQNGARRVLFASSACVYPGSAQDTPGAPPLREDQAYPADPEDGYGWEKLSGERFCRHYREDFGLDTRIVRLHNIYGPLCIYEGGREKSLAALCRKISQARDGDEIEIWGDGLQTRSYCYVDDAVNGLLRIMESDWHDPINLGTDRSVSINELFDLIAAVAGRALKKRHNPLKPQGVRGRNCDTSLLNKVVGWTPTTFLEEGLASTYAWIAERVVNQDLNQSRKMCG